MTKSQASVRRRVMTESDDWSDVEGWVLAYQCWVEQPFATIALCGELGL